MWPDQSQSERALRRLLELTLPSVCSLVACLLLMPIVGCSGSGSATEGSASGSGSGSGGPGNSSTSAGVGGTSGGGQGTSGVVINGVCYALCADASTDDDGDDWGFENDASCVVPGTVTAAAQACTVGESLPDPADYDPKPGVVIDDSCYPLCQVTMEPSDPDAPDWGYEGGSSCVLPGTKTAVAQECTTGQPLPDPSLLDPRPGVVVLDNSTGETACIPLCTASTDPAADPEGDDWDYEYGGSCVIPGSPTSDNQPCQTGEPLPPAVAKPGVVVVDGAGTAACVPLCQQNTDPAADPELDGWAYEDNSSCVIPGTAAAETNLPCTTTEPIPEDTTSRPGVVVTNADGELVCAAVCTFYTSPTQDGANDDGLADDWAWENNSTCIIPETITYQANQACETLQPLPDPEPRPGIVVNGDPVEDSCGWSECVPICQVVMEPSDPEFPDWGWENNTSCVIPMTDTHLWLPEGDEPRGYQQPPRACTWGEPVPDFLSPPPLDDARKVYDTFQVSGDQLLDPYGEPFLIRGVNNSHGWYDTCGQYMAYGALDNIAAEGANAVRVGWAFESIDPVGPTEGDPEKPVIGTNPELLAEILYRIVELQMIPILALNDSTGQTDTSWPLKMAQFLTSDGYKEVLEAYAPYLLVGIANEWNGTQWTTAYNQAVDYLRGEGINHTLVVTANDWGQGCQTILDEGAAVLANDPENNILFDVHIYNYLTLGSEHGGTATIVQNCLDQIASAGLPLLVGEFGQEHGGTPVEWQTIVQRANANAQGMTPWLWFGDTEYVVLDMNETWEGPRSAWGEDIIPQAVATGSKATIFD